MLSFLQRLPSPALGLCHCRAFSAAVYLQYTEGASAKFYKLTQGEGAAESSVTVHFGRVGTAGQSTTSTHASPAAALAFLRKTEAAKRKKGYSDSVQQAVEGTTAVQSPTAAAAAAAAAATFPVVLAEGESVQVRSASSSALYKVKCVSAVGGVPAALSCTCTGYTQRLQARGLLASTCRHIALVQGPVAEAARLAAAAAAPPPQPSVHSPLIPPLIALAHTWGPAQDPSRMLLSEKLDGMRALWHQGRLWSRQGNALHAPPSFTAALPQHCTLDGELHMGRGRFSDTMTVTRGQAASEERWKGVQYAVFDAPLAPGGFAARLAAAGAALAEGRRAAEAAAGTFAVESFAVLLPHTPCTGPEDLALRLQAMVAAGGEGLMLRNPDALFTSGRTHDLLKVKTFLDDEALVVGHEAGQGRNGGRVGALRCRLRSGVEFSCGSGLSDQQRQAPPPVGAVVTVKYFELSRDGVPRFPVFQRVRGDVGAGEFAVGGAGAPAAAAPLAQ